MTRNSPTRFEPGAPVEVRTHFTGRWSPGFEIEALIGDQVRVRRRSDGAVLPVALSVDDVRRSAVVSEPDPRVFLAEAV